MTYHPAANLQNLPGELPTGKIPEDVDKQDIADLAAEWMNDLEKYHLADNVIWRDILSFTDTFRTFYCPDNVHVVFTQLSKERSRSQFKLSGEEARAIQGSWLDIDMTFKIQDGDLIGSCAAMVSIVQDQAGQWKIWLIRTWLENYEGHGHPDEPNPASTNGHLNGASSDPEHVYDAIVAGGGQSGLGAAGRFKALGVDHILFDNRPSIGDSWADRYDSLKWHTVKEYGNLPFGRTWEPEAPMLLPTKQIGAGYKNWSVKYGINAQEGTSVDSAMWDEASQIWTVHTSGQKGDQQWKCKTLVLCIGTGHKTPLSPEWASEDKIKASGFQGEIIHSVNYHNANEFAGKRGVVIGTANTAHDVAEDMANLGMDTTMVQRGKTWVIPGAWLVGSQAKDYHPGKPTAKADREQITHPTSVLRHMANKDIWGGIRANPKLWDDLEAAGFKTERYGELYNHLYSRLGGHYVDIGNCARIIKGEVKIKTEAVQSLTEDGLSFEDGTELKADFIVLCTGFNHDFRKDAEQIVGEEIAAQMDQFWGLDSEGEIRGYAKLAGHPHLFYFGGEARLARFYSMFLALQVQKMMMGLPLRPYTGGR